MDASLEFIGLQNMLAAFREAPESFQKKHGADAVKAAAKVLRDATRARAATGFKQGYSKGRIRKFTSQIKLRYRPGKAELAYIVGIGRNSKILDGVKKSGKEPFYWRFMEYGFTTRDGVHHPAQPFLRPAVDATRDQMMQVMRTGIGNALHALEARLARGVASHVA